jgi:ATP-dependent helicase HrpB
MIISAGRTGDALLAAYISAILTERGLGGNEAHLGHRLEAFQRDRSSRADEMRRLARGWANQSGHDGQSVDRERAGLILSLAYPDRVAKARGAPGQFLMANGRAASVEPHDSLAREPFLAVAEIAGSAASARILLAAPMTAEAVDEAFAEHIATEDELVFDRSAAALRARRVRRLGALVLAEQTRPVPETEAAAQCLADGFGALGVPRWPLSKATKQWRDRTMFLRRNDPEWPDLSDEALQRTASNWLAPYLIGKTSLGSVDADLMNRALNSLLEWAMSRRLEEEAPTHFMAPTGNAHPIDYEAEEGPVLAIRVQELFGLKLHPAIAKGRLPLVLHLLSPGHRPIQITKDLPGFWRGSWADVKSEMKGRYPKHPWPDDPANALPTARAKPRGT